MPQRKQLTGCRKMLRRTFLFLLGYIVSNFLAEFFSVAENRSSFAAMVRQLWEKAIALRSSTQPEIAQKPLTSAPTPKSSISPKPIPQASVTPELLKPTPQPSITAESPKPSPATKLTLASAKGKPVQVRRRTLGGVDFYQTTIDLTDPETFITMGLANNAAYANSPTVSNGDEPFAKMVARHKAAVVANGTFFDKTGQKWVMGNMVAGGRFLKYSRWENYGTTLGIRAGNQLEMVTARAEGKPEWDQHWFSLTCGPRLIKQGKIWLSPKSEGFADPHVLGVGFRTAIGFPANRQQLFLITFLKALSLQQEAEIMKGIGCVEAMNLDGGASEALAHKGQILIPAGRNLTNVIVVYDTQYPAPEALKASWQRFQAGDRPSIPS